MASDRAISLSVAALQELRRIYCKHLLEVFASPETQELYERGCITGRFVQTHRLDSADLGDRPTSFIVEGVTEVGIAALHERER